MVLIIINILWILFLLETRFNMVVSVEFVIFGILQHNSCQHNSFEAKPHTQFKNKLIQIASYI